MGMFILTIGKLGRLGDVYVDNGVELRGIHAGKLTAGKRRGE
jgi:hypothetical protein